MSTTVVEISPPPPPQFTFNLEFQKRILQRFCRNKDFFLRIFERLDPLFFQNTYCQIIAQKVKFHYLQHKDIPLPEYLAQHVQESLLQDPLLSIDRFQDLLLYIYSTDLPPADPFLEESTEKFCQTQAMLEALEKGKSLTLAGDFESARTLVSKASSASGSAISIVRHKESVRNRIHSLTTDHLRKVPLLICPELDHYMDGGIGLGELMVILGPTGKGKTMFLVNFAKGAMMGKKKVLYVTLEVSAEIIGQRVDSSMSGMSRRDMRNDPTKAISSVETHYNQFGGDLIIARFLSGKCSVSSLEYLLNDLIFREGYLPDILIVDYADLIRASRDRNEKRYELSEIYTQLRELGVMFNIPIITASQSNRSSFSEEVVGLQHVSDDIGKAQIADVIVSLCQTESEFQATPHSLMRLYLAKNRNNQAGKSIPIHVNPATMQIFIPASGDSFPKAITQGNSGKRNPT